MFGPYTPLQQLDLLADDGTKSYVVGSTNSLLLQQKDRYSDILINVRHSRLLTELTLTNLLLARQRRDQHYITIFANCADPICGGSALD